MSKHRYISGDPLSSKNLSRTACAILLLLYYHVDEDNLVHKGRFIRKVGLDMDPRTWNKYWHELENAAVLVKVNIKTWMISPYQCYAEGRSFNSLLKKWNEAQHAIS